MFYLCAKKIEEGNGLSPRDKTRGDVRGGKGAYGKESKITTELNSRPCIYRRQKEEVPPGGKKGGGFQAVSKEAPRLLEG